MKRGGGFRRDRGGGAASEGGLGRSEEESIRDLKNCGGTQEKGVPKAEEGNGGGAILS